MALETAQPSESRIDDPGTTSHAGKYLTFILAGEEYGIAILRVTTIVGLTEVTAIPRTPPYIRGVINLRGKVIPVIDMRAKLGIEQIENTNETCIIVVEIEQNSKAVQIGMLVDSVSEVLDVIDEEIDPPPTFGAELDLQFILGMAKSNNDVKILLDVNAVLAGAGITSTTQRRIEES